MATKRRVFKFKNGITFNGFVPVFDEDFEKRAMGFTMDNPGFCIACGEEQDGCEPDARCYRCESCGKPYVYGFAEIAMRDWIA